MPVTAALIGGGAQLVGGIFKGITGGKQRREGKRLLAGLPQEVPIEVNRNQQLAEQMAAEGMPAEQYQRAMRNIQRQQLMALRGANDRRSAIAALPALSQSTNDATLNLDSADAQARMQNKRQLLDVNNQVANWKDRITQRKWQYAMGLLGMGNQNAASGFDQIIGGVGSLGSSLAGANFGNSSSSGSSSGGVGYDPAWDNYGNPGGGD